MFIDDQVIGLRLEFVNDIRIPRVADQNPSVSSLSGEVTELSGLAAVGYSLSPLPAASGDLSLAPPGLMEQFERYERTIYLLELAFWEGKATTRRGRRHP
jgi:hypothetical protein